LEGRLEIRKLLFFKEELRFILAAWGCDSCSTSETLCVRNHQDSRKTNNTPKRNDERNSKNNSIISRLPQDRY